MDFTFRFSPESSKGQEAWENFFLSSGSEDVETTGSIALLDSRDFQGDTFCSKDAFGTADFSNLGEMAYVNNGDVETLGSVAFVGYDNNFDSASSVSFDCGSASFSDCGSSSCSFVG